MVKNLTDGRWQYDSMRNCPFCGKPVAIEFNGFNCLYEVTHVDANPDCPMHHGIKIDAGERFHNSYHNAIEKWNMRGENV